MVVHMQENTLAIHITFPPSISPRPFMFERQFYVSFFSHITLIWIPQILQLSELQTFIPCCRIFASPMEADEDIDT